MAHVTKLPGIRHLRSEPSRHVLYWSHGKLKKSGRGQAFWFAPLSASLAEVPLDDRDQPFLFHARSRDHQDVTVQGVVTWRVADPELLAERVDFSIDARSGHWREQPLERIAEVLVGQAQQLAWSWIAAHGVREILELGVEAVRERLRSALAEDVAVADMGLAVVAVAVAKIAPTAELEKALQTPALESIQQRADEATFQRRALAVEKERAIAENELQNRIELAGRESELIARDGANAERRARDAAEAERIAAEAAAQRSRLAADAEAENVRVLEGARNAAEEGRIAIYEKLPAHVMSGLAAREFASKLQRIDHLNMGQDLLGPLFGDLLAAGARRLNGADEPVEN